MVCTITWQRGGTALCAASTQGHTHVVAKLLAAGADVSQVDDVSERIRGLNTIAKVQHAYGIASILIQFCIVPNVYAGSRHPIVAPRQEAIVLHLIAGCRS